MSKGAQSLVLMLMVAAVALGLVYWRHEIFKPQPAFDSAPVAAAPVIPPIRHPLQLPDATFTPDRVVGALSNLLGKNTTKRFILLDEFPRRVVATIDGLGRPKASPTLWPVHRTPGRFTVIEAGEGYVIAPSNAKRYTALVGVAERVNAQRAADLYLRMYPLLQRAYEELGYPNGYFNDRLIEVIDLLLATPEAGDRAKLQLTEVKGPMGSKRPWVRYEYADPALESLSAGQKILLRVGATNERKLKAKLVQFREAILKLSPAR
jgi:hypothetical protein